MYSLAKSWATTIMRHATHQTVSALAQMYGNGIRHSRTIRLTSNPTKEWALRCLLSPYLTQASISALTGSKLSWYWTLNYPSAQLRASMRRRCHSMPKPSSQSVPHSAYFACAFLSKDVSIWPSHLTRNLLSSRTNLASSPRKCRYCSWNWCSATWDTRLSRWQNSSG